MKGNSYKWGNFSNFSENINYDILKEQIHEHAQQLDKLQQKQEQVNRAKEYLLSNGFYTDGLDPSIQCCIISDLLRIINDTN